MKTFLVQYIISFFQRKDLDPGQTKFFILVFLTVVSWLAWAQEKTSHQVDRIADKIERIPGQIEDANEALSYQLYIDAECYAEKLILAITKGNADIIQEIDISDRRKDQVIIQINSRYDGLLNEVERLKQLQDRSYTIKARRIYNNETYENSTVEE